MKITDVHGDNDITYVHGDNDITDVYDDITDMMTKKLRSYMVTM